MTAAHCFTSVSREFLGGVSVVVGEFDRRVEDEEEQVFGVKTVSVHEMYRHASPMSYDIALVELDRHIRLGVHVQPLCLPLPDERVFPHTSCIVGGWGRIKERGRLPAVLREVRLDLTTPTSHCRDSSVCWAGERRERRLSGRRKNSHLGDSGGPLVCLAGSGGGHWVALGVTSWGKGCGRSWGDNGTRPPSRRGSPGIFTDVRLLLPWIKLQLKRADQKKQGNTLSGRSLVLEFELFDLENDSRCRYDRLTVSAGTYRPLFGAGAPHYPQSYSNDCVVRWVVYAPRGHIVKLDFADMELEESHTCLYDSLTVLGDVELTEEIAVLCGRSVPPPVLSYHSVMVLHFSSDSSVTHRGFRASLAFIDRADLHHGDHAPVRGQRGHQDYVTADGSGPAASHDVQQSSTRTTPYQGDLDQGPRLDDVDTSSDDEESSGGSSSLMLSPVGPRPYTKT
ncbi:ovochymase-2-like isoform X2 [Solea senegalensis]|nr:ovochymase-2-like isoform X2 [Solea senegalensis]